MEGVIITSLAAHPVGLQEAAVVGAIKAGAVVGMVDTAVEAEAEGVR